MQNWHPEQGDYVKQNAMQDSRKRKQKEAVRKVIVYGIMGAFILGAIAIIIFFA